MPCRLKGLGTLEAYWDAPAWLIYLGCIILLAVLAELVYRQYKQAAARGDQLPLAEAVQPLAFALASALVGTQAVVQAKCAAEAVKLIAEGCIGPVLASWYLYVTIILLASCGAAWLYRLNLALASYDPLFIIPLLQSQYIVCAVLSGGIYFQEFTQLDTKRAALFVLGILTLLSGLSLMLPDKAASKANDAGGAQGHRAGLVELSTEASCSSAVSRPAAGVNSYRIDVETGQMVLVGTSGQPKPPPGGGGGAASGAASGGDGSGSGGSAGGAPGRGES